MPPPYTLITDRINTHKQMSSYIKDKFKNVTAISFKAYDKELIISFTGFEDEEDINEYCEFVFNNIGMRSNFSEEPPTVH